ncbi:unnamed protein product, partial [Symbiodinium sp. KB8]
AIPKAVKLRLASQSGSSMNITMIGQVIGHKELYHLKRRVDNKDTIALALAVATTLDEKYRETDPSRICDRLSIDRFCLEVVSPVTYKRMHVEIGRQDIINAWVSERECKKTDCRIDGEVYARYSEKSNRFHVCSGPQKGKFAKGTKGDIKGIVTDNRDRTKWKDPKTGSPRSNPFGPAPAEREGPGSSEGGGGGGGAEGGSTPTTTNAKGEDVEESGTRFPDETARIGCQVEKKNQDDPPDHGHANDKPVPDESLELGKRHRKRGSWHGERPDQGQGGGKHGPSQDELPDQEQGGVQGGPAHDGKHGPGQDESPDLGEHFVTPEDPSNNPRSFNATNANGEQVSQRSERTPEGTEHISHKAINDQGDRITTRVYLNKSAIDSCIGSSESYTETRVIRGSPFQTVATGSAQLDKDRGAIIDDSVCISAETTEIRPEVKAAAWSGLEAGASNARHANEQRLHLTQESKLQALKDTAHIPLRDAALSTAKSLAQEKLMSMAPTHLQECMKSQLPFPMPTLDGERLRVDFAGGHSLSVGQRRRSGHEIARDETNMSSSQVERGVQFRCGIPQTAGIVGVGGNLGRTETTEQLVRKNGSKKTTHGVLDGFKGGVDVLGVEVLNLDTGASQSHSLEQEAGFFGRTIETNTSGHKVLGFEKLHQSSRHESNILGHREVNVDYCAGRATEERSYGLGSCSLVEVRTHGEIEKRGSASKLQRPDGSAMEGMRSIPGHLAGSTIEGVRFMETCSVLDRGKSSVEAAAGVCGMIDEARGTPEHLASKHLTTVAAESGDLKSSAKVSFGHEGVVERRYTTPEHLEFKQGTTSTEVSLGHGGHMIVGAGVAGLVEGGCDLLNGKDTGVALKDFASTTCQNIEDSAFMEATGLPIVHWDSDHVSAVFAQGISIGAGHEVGLYKTPQGEMQQDTTGVQLGGGIPGDPLQVVQARAAIGHTVDTFSTDEKSAAGTQHHEETCTTDGVELQLLAGNRSTAPVRIGHVCTTSRDSSSTVKEDGAKSNKVQERSYDGFSLGIADAGAVDKMARTTTESPDGAISYSTETFHGHELGFSTGLYNVSVETGTFEAESSTEPHSWKDSAGVQHSEEAHEVFTGTESQAHQSVLFGLAHWDHVRKEGHVEGVSETSSASDVTKDGAHVVSSHAEHTMFNGDRETLDGAVQEEHLSVHKDIRDHQVTTHGGDTAIEDKVSAYDGRRDSDTGDGNGSGTWHTDKSVHHESESQGFFGTTKHVSDVKISRSQEGDENGPVQEASEGDCDVTGKHSGLNALWSSTETFSIHDGEGDLTTGNSFFATTVHGKMHYDEQTDKVEMDAVTGGHVTLSPNANCAIASAASAALQCAIQKGYLDWQDCLQVAKIGVRQFCIFSVLQVVSEALSCPLISVGVVAGLFSACREMKALWGERALLTWDKLAHQGVIASGIASDVAIYMLFASNPYLQVILAAVRLFRDICREGYDAYRGNVKLTMAIRNVRQNPQLGAAGMGFLGAKIGLLVGGIAGPLGMGLGAAIGGAVGGVLGALLFRWWTGEPADRDLQYAYTFLEVSEECADAAIHAAYRRKARKLHPDKGGSAEEFRLLHHHYEKILQSRTAALRSEHVERKVRSLPGIGLETDMSTKVSI